MTTARHKADSVGGLLENTAPLKRRPLRFPIWRHLLAPVKSPIFFRRPIPLVPPCLKISVRPFGQEHFPCAAEVGAGLVECRSRAGRAFARVAAGIEAAAPFP